MSELLYKGSVKLVYSVPDRPDLVRFEFSDRISVYDKWIPNTVPSKGEVICRLASYWFEKIAAELDLKTHFVERTSPTEMLVKKIHVEHDYAKITPESRSELVPCEFIVRHYVAGSFHDRMEKGKLEGVAPGAFAYGAKMAEPYCETSTKVEPTDRLIPESEALDISSLSPAQLQEIWQACLRVDALIDAQVAKGGLIHVDGKKEFGRDENGDIMLVDVFGTPDEDRWWDVEAYERGEIIQYSKEFVRQHYRSTGYKDALYAARAAGEPEPEIPAMPAELVARTTELYTGLYERITGEKF